MNLTIFYAVMAGIAIVWHVVSGAMIVNELMKRKQKIQFIFINVMLPVYAHRYKKITVEETGKAGSLFYHYVTAANVALVFAIAANNFESGLIQYLLEEISNLSMQLRF